MKTFKEFQNNSNPLLQFVKARREGAEKTANKAKDKGGFAIPTAYHFKAKLPLYDEIIQLIESGKPLDLEKKYAKLHKELAGNKHWSMKEFQELTGRLEVLGEVSIKQSELSS